MVGKPNLPVDVDRRSDLRGAARPTPGLTGLDEEREASMADEGGAAGAVMESEDEAIVAQYCAGYDEGVGTTRSRLGRALLFGAAAGLLIGAVVSRRRSH